MLDAPAFEPTPHSSTLFLENYRAYSFAAVGIKPVLLFNERIHWRNEFYLFTPYRKVFKNTIDGTAYFGCRFKDFRYMASSSLVSHTPFGLASISLNYYDKEGKKFFIFFNFGYILLNPRIK